MKTNELMIGDWVYNCVANTTFKVYPQFFSQWHNKPEQFDATIHPVPITKEILEKNEWKCYNTYQMYSCSNVSFDLRAQKDGGFTVEVAADEYGSSTFMFIQYVHQFQHLLKLVGYEKEIIL